MQLPLKVGIVGGGRIFSRHAQAYRRIPKKVKICAICDIHEETCRERALEWGIELRYVDYNEMLASSDVQAVDIIVPNFLHLPVVKAAAESGKHILLEKPIARTVKEADEIIKIVSYNKVRLAMAYNWLFIPAVQKARQLLKQGYLGQILLVKAYSLSWFLYYTPTNFRLFSEKMGGGALIDTGIHFVYLLRNLVGEIAKVSSFNSSMLNELHDFVPEGETTSVTILQFDNKALGSLVVSHSTKLPAWRQGFPVGCGQRIDIYGERGAIEVDLAENRLKVFSENRPIPKDIRGWSEPPPDDQSYMTSYAREIEHFVDCLINEEEFLPAVRPLVAREDIVVAQAIYRSVETQSSQHIKGITLSR